MGPGSSRRSPPVDEQTLFRAYSNMEKSADIERWVIRELPSLSKVRYYVRDNHLGYATDPMTFAQAVKEAKRRNAAEVSNDRGA